MKKTLYFGSAIIALSFGHAAVAADLVSYEHSWSGLYGGVMAGVSSSDLTVLDGPDNVNCWWCVNNYGDSAGQSFLGGQVGYNHQINQFVLGIEGELSSKMVDGKAYDPTHDGPRGQVDDGLYGAITARLGYSLGSALIYGKAGWGAMDAHMSWADPVYSATANGDKTLSGAVFGGGVEFALSEAISLKAEYMRLNLGGSELLDVKGYCCDYQQRVDLDPINTFRIGVNFHLNPSN
jgi:outer membrane immunogenic protein